jgi:hypothetical protein
MQQSATHPSDSAGRPQGIAPTLAREQSWAAFLLAWVAAFSDAIGFLVLQQLGASFMSGNSMATGVALGRLDGAAVLETVSYHGIRRWELQTGKPWVSKLAKNAPNACKPVRDSVRLPHASLSGKGKGRCLDRRESAERIPRSGQASSNGRLPPEQELYEQIRPLVLFHQTAGERAKEIDVRKPHAGPQSGCV